MSNNAVLTLLLAGALISVPAAPQTKKAHILFSSNSHGYVDPCG